MLSIERRRCNEIYQVAQNVKSTPVARGWLQCESAFAIAQWEDTHDVHAKNAIVGIVDVVEHVKSLHDYNDEALQVALSITDRCLSLHMACCADDNQKMVYLAGLRLLQMFFVEKYNGRSAELYAILAISTQTHVDRSLMMKTYAAIDFIKTHMVVERNREHGMRALLEQIFLDMDTDICENMEASCPEERVILLEKYLMGRLTTGCMPIEEFASRLRLRPLIARVLITASRLYRGGDFWDFNNGLYPFLIVVDTLCGVKYDPM